MAQATDLFLDQEATTAITAPNPTPLSTASCVIELELLVCARAGNRNVNNKNVVNRRSFMMFRI